MKKVYLKKSNEFIALKEAVLDGRIDDVKQILKTANVNDKDELGWTPLMYAAKNNDLEITKILMENKPTFENISNAFNIALKNNSDKVVEYISIKFYEEKEKNRKKLLNKRYKKIKLEEEENEKQKTFKYFMFKKFIDDNQKSA